MTHDPALRVALRRLSSPGVPVLVAGPAGVGKTTVARSLVAAWTERAGRTPAPPRRVGAGEVRRAPALLALVREAGKRPVVLEDVDRLGRRGERVLADALRRGGPRLLVVTLCCDGDELAAATTAVDSDPHPDPPPLVPALLQLPPSLLRRVYIPPLSERRADIPLLAEHFLPRGVTLEPAALRALAAAVWPDETAGLAAVLQLAAARARGRGERTLSLATLAPLLAPEARAGAARALGLVAHMAAWDEGDALAGLGLRRALRFVEAALLARTLAATDGGLAATARRLGMPPSTLKSRLEALDRELALAAAWLP